MSDLIAISPILLATATGLMTMALDLLSGRDADKGFLGWVTAVGMLAAGAMLLLSCTSASSARKAVDWQVLMVIAASFGMGIALAARKMAANCGVSARMSCTDLSTSLLSPASR